MPADRSVARSYFKLNITQLPSLLVKVNGTLLEFEVSLPPLMTLVVSLQVHRAVSPERLGEDGQLISTLISGWSLKLSRITFSRPEGRLGQAALIWSNWCAL